MVRAIPRRLLIHKATLKTGNTTDKWGNPSWEYEQTLDWVRFEPTEKLKLTKDNKEIQCSLLMFYDCTHSRPLNTSFEVGQVVHWRNTDYEIVSIDYLEDERPHHLEIGLI